MGALKGVITLPMLDVSTDNEEMAEQNNSTSVKQNFSII